MFIAGQHLYIAAWGYGVQRIDWVDRVVAGAPSLRVGLVQANLGVVEKSKSGLLHRTYLEQTRELAAGGWRTTRPCSSARTA